jgi:hypothetical protein
VYLAKKYGDDAFQAKVAAKLKSAIAIHPTRSGDTVTVTLENRGAGHMFPTGVTDIREPWVELQAVDAQKKTLARYGGPDAVGLIAPTSARLGIDIAGPSTELLLLHELSETTRIPFDRRVAPMKTLDVSIPAPTSLPDGAVELDAVLFYRNVRTTYFRAATGDPMGAAPDVEVAREVVP